MPKQCPAMPLPSCPCKTPVTPLQHPFNIPAMPLPGRCNPPVTPLRYPCTTPAPPLHHPYTTLLRPCNNPVTILQHLCETNPCKTPAMPMPHPATLVLKILSCLWHYDAFGSNAFDIYTSGLCTSEATLQFCSGDARSVNSRLWHRLRHVPLYHCQTCKSYCHCSCAVTPPRTTA